MRYFHAFIINKFIFIVNKKDKKIPSPTQKFFGPARSIFVRKHKFTYFLLDLRGFEKNFKNLLQISKRYDIIGAL